MAELAFQRIVDDISGDLELPTENVKRAIIFAVSIGCFYGKLPNKKAIVATTMIEHACSDNPAISEADIEKLAKMISESESIIGSDMDKINYDTLITHARNLKVIVIDPTGHTQIITPPHPGPITIKNVIGGVLDNRAFPILHLLRPAGITKKIKLMHIKETKDEYALTFNVFVKE
jgi:hypothetical protein